jgi:hypothetical protein
MIEMRTLRGPSTLPAIFHFGVYLERPGGSLCVYYDPGGSLLIPGGKATGSRVATVLTTRQRTPGFHPRQKFRRGFSYKQNLPFLSIPHQ